MQAFTTQTQPPKLVQEETSYALLQLQMQVVCQIHIENIFTFDTCAAYVSTPQVDAVHYDSHDVQHPWPLLLRLRVRHTPVLHGPRQPSAGNRAWL